MEGLIGCHFQVSSGRSPNHVMMTDGQTNHIKGGGGIWWKLAPPRASVLRAKPCRRDVWRSPTIPCGPWPLPRKERQTPFYQAKERLKEGSVWALGSRSAKTFKTSGKQCEFDSQSADWNVNVIRQETQSRMNGEEKSAFLWLAS